jgi:hypothetical protein
MVSNYLINDCTPIVILGGLETYSCPRGGSGEPLADDSLDIALHNTEKTVSMWVH